MKKILFITLFFALSVTGYSKEEAQEPPPLDPKFMGVHGMVLVNNGSRIYASHLPTYDLPHNVQLVYKLEVKDIALIQLVRDADLVTVQPEPFNLQRMMRGEKFDLTVDVYMGHFERDGMVTYKNITLTFEKQLYMRNLDSPEKSQDIQKYDTINLPGNERLLVHQIQTRPSYDHLILLSENVNCATQLHTSSAVPSQGELHQKLSICGSMKPLYYETDDFQKIINAH